MGNLKVIHARPRDDGTYLLKVHLDVDRLVNSQPDPAWVMEFYVEHEPPDVPRAAWLQAQLLIVREQAKAERQRRLGSGNALVIEGDTFPP